MGPSQLDVGPGRCRGCGAPLATAHCPTCGDVAWSERDRSLWGYVVEGAVALFGADSTLWRSWGLLLAKPGELSRRDRDGPRLGLLRPLQLYLVCALGYFVLFPWTGVGSFVSTLESQRTRQVYSGVVAPTIERRIVQELERGAVESEDAASAALAERFDPAFKAHSRRWLVAFVPLITIGLALFARTRRHGVLSALRLATEFGSFQLLGFGVLFPFALSGFAWGMRRLGGEERLERLPQGDWIELLFLACVLLWWFLALGRARGYPWLGRTLRATAMTFWTLVSLVTYRFGLFWATMWSL